MRKQFKGIISSSFDAQLYINVFTCYKNKFDVIQRKLQFEVAKFNGFEFINVAPKIIRKVI